MKYAPLFEPIRVGNLTLKNRFVMAPMSTHMAHDGLVTSEEVAYYARRAEGGAAMLIVGSVCIRPDGDFGGQIYIDNDDRIEGLRRLTDAIHQSDCLAMAQIHHSGRETNISTCGYQPVSPSYFEPEIYSVFKAEYDPPPCVDHQGDGRLCRILCPSGTARQGIRVRRRRTSLCPRIPHLCVHVSLDQQTN